MVVSLRMLQPQDEFIDHTLGDCSYHSAGPFAQAWYLRQHIRLQPTIGNHRLL